MPTPSGAWAVLNPNPFLSPYINYNALRPRTGEFGFAIYFCAPAPTDLSVEVTLVFVKPTYATSFAARPFLAVVPNFLYIPGYPAWCYIIEEGDLDEGGTYAVYLAEDGRRVTNNAPFRVSGPSLPPFFGHIFELDETPLDSSVPLGP